MSKLFVVENAIDGKDFFMLGDWVMLKGNEPEKEIINIQNIYDVEKLKLKHGISDQAWFELINTTNNGEAQFKSLTSTFFVWDVLKEMQVPSRDIEVILDVGLPELAMRYANQNVPRHESPDPRLKNLVLTSKSPKLISKYFDITNEDPGEDIKPFILEHGDLRLMIGYCVKDDNYEMRNKIIESSSASHIYDYLNEVGKNEEARKALIESCLDKKTKFKDFLGWYLVTVDSEDQQIFDIIVENGFADAAGTWIINAAHCKKNKNYKRMLDTLMKNANERRTDILVLSVLHSTCDKSEFKKSIQELKSRILSSKNPLRIIANIVEGGLELNVLQKKKLRDAVIKQNNSEAAYLYCSNIEDLASMRKVIIKNRAGKYALEYYNRRSPREDMLNVIIRNDESVDVRDIRFRDITFPESQKDIIRQAFQDILSKGEKPAKVYDYLTAFPEDKAVVRELILQAKEPKTAAYYFSYIEQDVDIKQIVIDSNDVEAVLICADVVRYDKDLERIVMTHGDYDQQSEYREKTLL